MITRIPVATAKDHHNLIMTTTESTTNTPIYRTDADAPRRTTETKSGVKTTETSPPSTTELIVFVLSVLGVLIAAADQRLVPHPEGIIARSDMRNPDIYTRQPLR
jgi:hypothetical protein